MAPNLDDMSQVWDEPLSAPRGPRIDRVRDVKRPGVCKHPHAGLGKLDPPSGCLGEIYSIHMYTF